MKHQPKPPLPLHISGACMSPRATHRLCGGWTCACDCHDADAELPDSPSPPMASHQGPGHMHDVIGDCVWCECGIRLYHGSVMSAENFVKFAQSLDVTIQAAADEWRQNRQIIAEAKRARAS